VGTDELISEHPPFDMRTGQREMARRNQCSDRFSLVDEFLRSSSSMMKEEGSSIMLRHHRWMHTAWVLRRAGDVISPYAKRGYVSDTWYEHNSILKFIERRFGLPSLASVNHQF